MHATFNIKVNIDTDNVSTVFGSERIEDMDTTLLASVLKVFGDVQNKVRTQVAKFYDLQKGQINEAVQETEQEGDQPEQAPEEQPENGSGDNL